MKKLLVLLPLFLFTACASNGTTVEPHELPRKDKVTGVFNFGLGSVFEGSAKKRAEKDAKLKQQNDELRARIERLENNSQDNSNQTNSSSSNSTVNKAGGNRTTNPSNDAVSFREWSNARQKGSNEYDEFKEYQKWLEFKKYKEQTQ